MVQKVISSGQAGVAQAALRAASSCGLMTGGWCVPGQRMEGVGLPEMALVEIPRSEGADGENPDGRLAAEWNVRDADATLVFRPNDLAATDLVMERTFAAAYRYGKAVLVCDPADAQVAEKIVQWLLKVDPWTVNVVGPGETARPGIGDWAYDMLRQILQIKQLGVAAGGRANSARDRKETLEVRQARMQNDAAWKIARLRAQVGLNQSDLATLMGTSRSAIYRLENPDYWGHSLPVLRRLASAVGMQLEIRFVPNGNEPPQDTPAE